MIDLDPQMAAALQTFFEESRELLQDMENALLFMENAGADSERINAVFRAAHTIKGSAGLFGLEEVVRFTHRLENLLDQIRSGVTDLTPVRITLLLSCGDHIAGYLDRIATDSSLDQVFLAEDLRLLGDLAAQLGSSPVASIAPAIAPALAPTTLALTVPPSPEPEFSNSPGSVQTGNWHISLRFGLDTFRDGMDPLSFLRYLEQIGEIIGIVTLTDSLPALSQMDAESCYLGFEISFRSSADTWRPMRSDSASDVPGTADIWTM